MKIEFKFEPDQLVKTSLGDEGLIESCAYHLSNSLIVKRYFITFKGGNGAWWDEDKLEALIK